MNSNYKADDLLADLNLEPIGHCSRCGRKVWKRETLGKLDEMTQPDGGICGGRFRPAKNPGSDVTGAATRR